MCVLDRFSHPCHYGYWTAFIIFTLLFTIQRLFYGAAVPPSSNPKSLKFQKHVNLWHHFYGMKIPRQFFLHHPKMKLQFICTMELLNIGNILPLFRGSVSSMNMHGKGGHGGWQHTKLRKRVGIIVSFLSKYTIWMRIFYGHSNKCNVWL